MVNYCSGFSKYVQYTNEKNISSMVFGLILRNMSNSFGENFFVFDYGCGDGYFSSLCAAVISQKISGKEFTYCAIDIEEQGVASARRFLNGLEIPNKIITGNIEESYAEISRRMGVSSKPSLMIGSHVFYANYLKKKSLEDVLRDKMTNLQPEGFAFLVSSNQIPLLDAFREKHQLGKPKTSRSLDEITAVLGRISPEEQHADFTACLRLPELDESEIVSLLSEGHNVSREVDDFRSIMMHYLPVNVMNISERKKLSVFSDFIDMIVSVNYVIPIPFQVNICPSLSAQQTFRDDLRCAFDTTVARREELQYADDVALLLNNMNMQKLSAE